MSNRKIYRVASLFSGCGGLDLGFIGDFDFMGQHYKKNNIRIDFANDIDIDATTCYNSNELLAGGKHVKCILDDIRNISADSLPDYDILLAGFPCQPFSNAGNRKGIRDSNGRGTLFEECERIIRAKIESGKKPLAFVFENVRGILSSKMDSGITVPTEIENRMKKLGYNVSMQLVCASDYGVPQMRYRVLIIGTDDKLPTFDFKTMKDVVEEYGIPSLSFGKSEKLLLGKVLLGIESETENDFWEFTSSTQHMIELIGGCSHGKKAIKYFEGDYKKENLPKSVFEGRSWKNIPPSMLTPRFKKIYDDPRKYHAPKFYRRFAYGEVNGTITASAQPENCGITHPVENRRFTVREIARIQSFPDNFRFESIPLQSRYKVVGNAVPPVLAWVVANALIKTIK